MNHYLTHPALPVLLFAVIYVISYKPAVRMFRDLVALSVVGRRQRPPYSLTKKFIALRLVLFAPYLAFFIFGKDLPIGASKIVLYMGVMMAFFGSLQILGRKHFVRFLWWIYGWVYDGLLGFYPYRNLVAIVTERLALQDGMSLLEVGCGTGNVIVSARKSADIWAVGVDNSSSMLHQARKKLRVGLRDDSVVLYRQDALEFLRGIPEDSFDRISLVNFLYATPDRNQVWMECLRILRPGGLAVATTSVQSGSKAIINESKANNTRLGYYLQYLHPRLVMVMIVDYFISGLADAGAFEFPDQEVLIAEVDAVGGLAQRVERCYGGPEEGVNIVFDVLHAAS
jgi:ubiquinone/menaquinone biosynthesis C-methylase UbiE